MCFFIIGSLVLQSSVLLQMDTGKCSDIVAFGCGERADLFILLRLVAGGGLVSISWCDHIDKTKCDCFSVGK